MIFVWLVGEDVLAECSCFIRCALVERFEIVRKSKETKEMRSDEEPWPKMPKAGLRIEKKV
jgi:hypothetical protein